MQQNVSKNRPKMQSESVFVTKLIDEIKTGRAVAVRLLKNAFLLQYCSMNSCQRKIVKHQKQKDDKDQR